MTNTTTRLLLLLAALCYSAASTAECTIDCLHDTQCVHGDANFTWHPVTPGSNSSLEFHKELSRDGWHCGCPPGLTGLRCGRHYESCNDGEHVCYNGGQCIATMKDIYQNDQQYCDCPSTVDDKGNTQHFSGKYCEVEVTTSGNRCGDEGQNPCQNGGSCKQTVDELDPCDCAEGYVGRMCEFFEPSVPQCSLKCQHGGSCRYGTKEEDHSLVLNEPDGQQTSNVHVIHENFMFCECPDGYSGVHCETEEVLCGNIKCRHGATCVSVDNLDSKETTHHCDCNAINKQKMEKGQDIQFSGRHCEIASTSVCHYDDDPTVTTFCTHNGTCPEEGHEHCTCPEGYHGAHCQFRTKDILEQATTNLENAVGAPSHATCKLDCKNGGNCRKGSKQDEHVQELVSKYGSELGSFGLNISYNQDFEHCACPKGFVGIECEYSMTQCGDDGELHPCFHGSTCDMVNGIPTCICEDSETQSAGIFCQHLASNGAICDPQKFGEFGKDIEANTENDPTKGENGGFCVNGGVCVTTKDGSVSEVGYPDMYFHGRSSKTDPSVSVFPNREGACRCHKDFEGPHCEYTKNSTKSAATKPDSSNESSALSGGAKFGITMAVLICVGVMGFGYRMYQRKKVIITEDVPSVYPDMSANMALDDESLRASPVVDVGPEKDFDGNELKNVELL